MGGYRRRRRGPAGRQFSVDAAQGRPQEPHLSDRPLGRGTGQQQARGGERSPRRRRSSARAAGACGTGGGARDGSHCAGEFPGAARGRIAARNRQAVGRRRSRGQRNRVRGDRTVAAFATGALVPRARPSSRSRYVGHSLARQETRSAGCIARAASRWQGRQALSRVGSRTLAASASRSPGVAAQVCRCVRRAARARRSGRTGCDHDLHAEVGVAHRHARRGAIEDRPDASDSRPSRASEFSHRG